MNLRVHCPAVYGPVQSRRHGLSLGINLGDPQAKICTWGCIYCQCGFGERKEATEDLESRNLPTIRQVCEEIEAALEKHPNLDSVTFAGNSEPTAHPHFPEIVQEILAIRKQRNGQWIFNVLSNGSELGNDRVVEACDFLDECWVKLDCAIDSLFKRLNRPVASVGPIAGHIERIKRLKRPMIQTLFWTSSKQPEVANWTEANREAILAAYIQIQPKLIFITTTQREPAFPAIEPVSPEELQAFGARAKEQGFSVRVFS